jgi:alpha-galactosidase
VKAVKIAIIGAGSASFGLSSLATMLREPSLHGSTVALVDLNGEGLKLVLALAQRMNRVWDAGLTIESHIDRSAALDGADFVVCSIEVGPREELWQRDWEVTRRHGIHQPYAENGGPGGFFHAARNIPHILDIARDMERLCPQAPFICLSNPLPRLCRAVAKYTRITPIGLCHGIAKAYSTAGIALAEQLGLDVPAVVRDPHAPHEGDYWPVVMGFQKQVEQVVDIKAAGINHFTWILDIRDRRTGEDLYPALRERMLAIPKEHEPLTVDMLRVSGYVPVTGDTHISEYLPYTHDPVTKPYERYRIALYNWSGAARGRDRMWGEIERLAADDGPDLGKLRGAHSEGVYEVIHGIAHDANLYRVSINVTNGGAISNLPDETIVEVPAMIGGMGVLPLRVGALPPMVAELCRREAALVEMVVDAAVHGDRALAYQALAMDSLAGDLEVTKTVLDDYLLTHRDVLPQFFGGRRL